MGTKPVFALDPKRQLLLWQIITGIEGAILLARYVFQFEDVENKVFRLWYNYGPMCARKCDGPDFPLDPTPENGVAADGRCMIDTAAMPLQRQVRAQMHLFCTNLLQYASEYQI